MRSRSLQIHVQGGLLENIIDMMTLCYIVMIGVSSDVISASMSNLWCAVIIALCFCYKLKYGISNITRFTAIMFLFVAFCVVSLTWSRDFSTSKERVTTVILLFIFSSLLYEYLVHQKKELRFLHMVCLGGVLYAIYILFSYGIKNYITLLAGGNRIGSAVTSFNNNGVGRITAITSILCFGVFINEKRWKYLFGCALCAWIMLGSGSRTAIGGFAAGLISVFLLKRTRKRYLYIVGGALTFFIALLVLELPAFEFASSRVDQLLAGLSGNKTASDYSTLERMRLNQVAIKQFLETPILGIGIGSSTVLTKSIMGIPSYMHNNYLELLCCGGLIGTAIYYIQYFVPVRHIARDFKDRTNEQTIALTMVIMYLIMHFGTVSYFDKSVYIHMVLIHLLAEQKGAKMSI